MFVHILFSIFVPIYIRDTGLYFLVKFCLILVSEECLLFRLRKCSLLCLFFFFFFFFKCLWRIGINSPLMFGRITRKAVWTPLFFVGSFKVNYSVCLLVMCAKLLQSCPILCNPVDCSPPGSVHRILQERMLEWVTTPSSRGSSQPRDQICVSYICIGRLVLYHLHHLGSLLLVIVCVY